MNQPKDNNLTLYLTVIAALLLSLFFTAACHKPDRSPVVPLDPLSRADEYYAAARKLAGSGNLGFHNFVIALPAGLIANSNAQGMFYYPHNDDEPFCLFSQTGDHFTWGRDWLYFTTAKPIAALRKMQVENNSSIRIRQSAYHHIIYVEPDLWAIDEESGQIVCFNPDGSDLTVIFDGTATDLILVDSSLFFSGRTADRGMLGRIDPRSGQIETLLERQVESLNEEDGWLYFLDPQQGHQVFSFNYSDKKEDTLTGLAVWRPFIVYDDYLFYIDPANQNRLFSLPIKNGRLADWRPQMVVDDVVDSYVVLPDAVYYRRSPDGSVYRLVFGRDQSEPLS